MASEFMKVKEFALAYGVSEKTVWRMVKSGAVYSVQPGGPNHARRIPCEELERLKTGARPDGRAPVLRGVDAEEEKQIKHSLPGPKPRWQRRRR